MSYIANILVENGNLVINEDSIPDVVGSHKRGGIIYHIFQPGETGYVSEEIHGLVAAPVDLPYKYQFAYQGWTGNTTPGSDFLDGSGNTTALIDEFATYSTEFKHAARAARAYQGGGYTDWYLGSLKEMNYMCPALWDGHLEYINTIPEAETGWSPYWSSTSYESGAMGALFMSDVVVESGWNSGNPGWAGWGGSTPEVYRLVRPIRKF